jgi:hypothetical protein
MYVLALCFLLLPGSRTWVVDDDGPADFTTIGEAIASPRVGDGNTLLVHPGSYPAFTLDRELRIVAASGESFVVDACNVLGAPAFTIAGMRTQTTQVTGVPGRGVFDDCDFGVLIATEYGLIWQGWTQFAGCAQILVTRASFNGSEGCYPEWGTTKPGLQVSSSNLALVDCGIYGGADDLCNGHPTDGAKPGLDISNSFATISGCTILGGQGISSLGFPGAPAIEMNGEMRIRGSACHHVRGGSGWGGFAPPITGSGVATISGVRYDTSGLPSWVDEPSPAEPYLRIVGDDTPGSTKTVELYGPPGRGARVLWGSAADLELLIPGLDPLWFDRSGVQGGTFVTAAGQDVPVSFPYPLPATASPGDTMVFQAFFPAYPGQGPFLTSPGQIVIRW